MTERLTIKPQPPAWAPKSGNFGTVLMLWLVNLLGACLLRLRSVVRFTEVWWVFVQKTKMPDLVWLWGVGVMGMGQENGNSVYTKGEYIC